MENSTTNVLKAEEVTFEGQVQLDAKSNVQNRGRKPPVASALPEAKIVESNTEYVIVETVCSCGRKILVKCTYQNN